MLAYPFTMDETSEVARDRLEIPRRLIFCSRWS
jgi:hypothetical protein